MNPDFSIIVPTHNRAILLPRALASAMRQKGPRFEVIVVDDGSAPPTVLPDEFCAVKLLRNDTPLGPGGARNAGIRRARGRWVTFLDDDDELLDDFLAVTMDTLTAHSAADFCWSGVEFATAARSSAIVPDRTFVSTYVTQEDMFVEALSIGTGFGLTIERRRLLEIGLFDPRFSITEDIEMLFRMLSNGLTGVGVEGVHVRVHDHDGERLTGSRLNHLRASQCEALFNLYPVFIADNPRVEAQLRAHVDSLRGACPRLLRDLEGRLEGQPAGYLDHQRRAACFSNDWV